MPNPYQYGDMRQVDTAAPPELAQYPLDELAAEIFRRHRAAIIVVKTHENSEDSNYKTTFMVGDEGSKQATLDECERMCAMAWHFVQRWIEENSA